MPICVHNLLQGLVQNAVYPSYLVLVKVCTSGDLLALNCYNCCMVLLFVNNTFLQSVKIFLCCNWKEKNLHIDVLEYQYRALLLGRWHAVFKDLGIGIP